MRNLGLLLLALVVPIAGSNAQAPASVFEHPKYDSCLLRHLSGAKLDFASVLIRQACDENYRDPGFTSDQEKAYNECLLAHLQGVESLNAALQIQGACDRRHNNE